MRRYGSYKRCLVLRIDPMSISSCTRVAVFILVRIKRCGLFFPPEAFSAVCAFIYVSRSTTWPAEATSTTKSASSSGPRISRESAITRRARRCGCRWPNRNRPGGRQFHFKPWRKRLVRYLRAFNAIQPVASVVILVYIVGVKNDVSVSGTTERIRFNPSSRALVEKIDTETVRSRKANDFEM